MRVSRIFYPGYLPDNLLNTNQTQVVLNEETSHYLIRVLRLNINDPLIIFGKHSSIPPFYEYISQITNINTQKKHKPEVTVTLLKKTQIHTESPLHISLIQSISKNDTMDWIIQKAVELGVTQIYPIYTEYGNIKFDAARSLKKTEHWQKIAISACEQSERVCVPTITLPQNIRDYLQAPFEGISLLLHPRTLAPLNIQLLTHPSQPNNIRFIIGPEGGLSPDEITLLEKYDFKAISLGTRILRTETAAISTITLLQYLKGDIGVTAAITD